MIVELHRHPKVGPYILTRNLGRASTFAGSPHDWKQERIPGDLRRGPGFARLPAPPERFLALHEHAQTSHVAYRFAAPESRVEERRLVEAIQAASLFEHTHALKIQQFTFDITGDAWVITPFTGDADGLRTLSRLLRDKGGQLDPIEARLAVTQLLELVSAAHSSAPVGLTFANGAYSPTEAIAGDREAHAKAAPLVRPVSFHGPISLDEVLVDRHGCLRVELYGVGAGFWHSGSPSIEILRDEVRSVVELGYQLITGIRADEPIIPAQRLVPALGQGWSNWLARGLDPARSFDSAEAALAELPRVANTPGVSVVRGVIDRFRAPR